MKRAGIFWFRNDLRLDDNPALRLGIDLTSKLYPVFCIDPRWLENTPVETPKIGIHRYQFLLESLEDLKQQLRMKGSDLIVRIGHPETVIPRLADQVNAEVVFTSKEITSEEVSIEETLEIELAKYNIGLKLEWQSTLFHKEDIPFPIPQVPDIFSSFRKKIEKEKVQVRYQEAPIELSTIDIAPGTIPTLEELFKCDKTSTRKLFKGGESAALDRLNHYIWETDAIKDYKNTRNGLLGMDYSSKFSAWLSLGCLSPRRIYKEVRKYEQERTKNQSTYWMIFELIWRDYFKFVALKYGNAMFKKYGIKNDPIEFIQNQQIFEKWCRGETGIPFIDANMKELNETGFMSNRGRQNVASFLVKDLRIDWRWGAYYFESQLIDYDPCSNWGNWNYVAGIGNDPREDRYFNVLLQADRYDRKGEFVKTWIPELKPLKKEIHYPKLLTDKELTERNVRIGVDYPNPLIPWEKRAKEIFS